MRMDVSIKGVLLIVTYKGRVSAQGCPGHSSAHCIMEDWPPEKHSWPSSKFSNSNTVTANMELCLQISNNNNLFPKQGQEITIAHHTERTEGKYWGEKEPKYRSWNEECAIQLLGTPAFLLGREVRILAAQHLQSSFLGKPWRPMGVPGSWLSPTTVLIIEGILRKISR